MLARSLDLPALRRLLTGLPASFYFISLAVVLAGQVAYAWRWRLLLQAAGVDVPFTNIVRQYFVGIFVNNFLPSTVGGDVAKVYYLGDRYGYRAVTASVVMDRVLGVGLLAALAVLGLALSPISAPRLTAAQIACAAIAITAVVALAVTTGGTGGLAPRAAWLGERAVRLAGGLQRLRLDMAAPLGRPAVVLQAAAIVFAYTVAIAAVYMRFVSVQNAVVPPFIAMF